MRCLLCRHREWEPLDCLPYVEGGNIRFEWTRQRCLRCGRIRDTNLLKPGESISFAFPLT